MQECAPGSEWLEDEGSGIQAIAYCDVSCMYIATYRGWGKGRWTERMPKLPERAEGCHLGVMCTQMGEEQQAWHIADRKSVMRCDVLQGGLGLRRAWDLRTEQSLDEVQYNHACMCVRRLSTELLTSYSGREPCSAMQKDAGSYDAAALT